jgi:type 1 glutamine amidotransferase
MDTLSLAVRALIVQGGWDGHSPTAFAEAYAGMLREEEFAVEIADTLDVLVDGLDAFDLVVPIWTMGSITEPQLRGLLDAVAGGVGLAGFHGGAGDAFRAAAEYQFMCGGQWVAHPGNIIDYRVDVTKPDDPIMRGINSFPYRSEQYYMHVDPMNEVLATTTFTGEHAWWINGAVMPVVWKRRHGKGRVFYSSLGHVSKDF